MSAKSSKKAKLKATKKTAPTDSVKKNALFSGDLPSWLPVVIFIIADLIFFYEQIFGGMHFWATFMSDFNELHIPFQTFIQDSLRQGQIPFWNPYTFGGMPFLADIQVGFFYPLNLILSLLAPLHGLPVKAMELQIIFHFLIAQVSMYYLTRHFKVSRTGAVIAALSYSLSGALVYRVVIQTFIYQFAWLPLLFLLFHKTITRLKWTDALLAGLVLGLTMLVGHPQAIFYNVLLIGLLILWNGAAGIINKEIQGRRILVFTAIAALPFVIALGVSAIQLLHTQELASLSKRTLLTYKEAVDGSLQFKQLLTVITPKLFGFTDMSQVKHVPFYIALRKGYHFWETGFYFGIPALILGLIGIAKNYRSRLMAFLIFAAVIGFLHALGSNGFLFKLLFHLPGFDKFRFPARTIYYLVFGFSIFAGFGYDAIAKQKEKLKFSVIAVAAALPLVLAIAVLSGVLPSAFGAPQPFIAEIKGYGFTALIFIVVSGAAIFMVYEKTKIPPMISGLLLITVVVADLTVNLSAFKNHNVSPERLYKINPNLSAVLKAKPPRDIFRVKMRNKFVLPLRRNSGMVNKIMLIEGFNALQLLRKIQPCKAWPQLLSVRYRIKTDEKTRQSYFQQQKDILPHARMTYKTIISSAENVAADIKSDSLDFENESLIEKKLGLTLPQVNISAVKNSVTCAEYGNNYQKYEVSTAANGLLNISEIWYPAWKVKIDGQPAELLRINYCLRGVVIPAGTHTIEMAYDSAAFNAGMWITLLTLLLTMGFLIRNWKRERQDKALNG